MTKPSYGDSFEDPHMDGLSHVGISLPLYG